MAHIRGRAAHVEADDPREPRACRRLYGAHHAAGRAGQDRIFATKETCGRETAGRLHEQQPRRVLLCASVRALVPMRRECARQAVHIAAEQRRQICVHHGRIAPADELYQRTHLVADGDLVISQLPGEGGCVMLVGGMRVGVHEDDGNGIDAVFACIFQGNACALEVQRNLDRSVGTDTLGHLHYALIQHGGFLDPPRKDLGARLVADLKSVSKSFSSR